MLVNKSWYNYTNINAHPESTIQGLQDRRREGAHKDKTEYSYSFAGLFYI